MSEFGYRTTIISLVHDSPIVATDIVRDILETVQAGEYEIAFDTLCSWIYEDELSISREYYDRLVRFSAEVGCEEQASRLQELVA